MLGLPGSLASPPLEQAQLFFALNSPRSTYAVWVLLGKFKAMKNCVRSNWGLATISCETNVLFIALLSPIAPSNAPFVEEKSVKSTEIPPRFSDVGDSS
jgi:hypothetical protein